MLGPELANKISKAIRDKAKEIVPDYPNCTAEDVFEKMPDFYKHVSVDLKLLPKEVTFQMFWEAAVHRYKMMEHYASYGFF